jgi:hypothetical protein
MTPMATAAHPTPRTPRSLWTRLAAVPVTALLLLLGLWVFSAVVAPGYDASLALGFAWFAVAYFLIRAVTRRHPALKRSALATYAAVAIGIGAWVAITTFRDVTVNEEIAVGVVASQTGGGAGTEPGAPGAPQGGQNVELAGGEFESLAHGGSGRAAIVELEDGTRVLTFDDLDTDNGPDLRVYLVAGEVTGGSVGDFVDLGGLKGNRGDQQYEIPPDVDVSRYATVAIWCRAFGVGFARAALAPS